MSIRYTVTVEEYAQRHYIRTFAKKYKGAWDLTFEVLREEFERFDILLQKSIAEEITDKNSDIIICKTEFKIAGTQESRHGSGNRCIVAKHKSASKICVLLIYHKNDLGGGNETVNWKNVVKLNFPEYEGLV
jgi:hypothetical protein